MNLLYNHDKTMNGDHYDDIFPSTRESESEGESESERESESEGESKIIVMRDDNIFSSEFLREIDGKLDVVWDENIDDEYREVFFEEDGYDKAEIKLNDKIKKIKKINKQKNIEDYYVVRDEYDIPPSNVYNLNVTLCVVNYETNGYLKDVKQNTYTKTFYTIYIPEITLTENHLLYVNPNIIKGPKKKNSIPMTIHSKNYIGVMGFYETEQRQMNIYVKIDRTRRILIGKTNSIEELINGEKYFIWPENKSKFVKILPRSKIVRHIVMDDSPYHIKNWEHISIFDSKPRMKKTYDYYYYQHMNEFLNINLSTMNNTTRLILISKINCSTLEKEKMLNFIVDFGFYSRLQQELNTRVINLNILKNILQAEYKCKNFQHNHRKFMRGKTNPGDVFPFIHESCDKFIIMPKKRLIFNDDLIIKQPERIKNVFAGLNDLFGRNIFGESYLVGSGMLACMTNLTTYSDLDILCVRKRKFKRLKRCAKWFCSYKPLTKTHFNFIYDEMKIDIFTTKCPRKTITEFHLPCVRGFLSINELFYLMTHTMRHAIDVGYCDINPDYFMSGKMSNMEIIQKYFNYGMGFVFNEMDCNRFLKVFDPDNTRMNEYYIRIIRGK